MSLQLKVFGGLSLVESATGASKVTRRHRLAVLAVLASSDRPVPRERLLSLLWPDNSDESARHALGQVLYGLRQDVALGDLVTGATDLSLDRSKFSCDLWEFREALRQGNRAEAIALYVGPFLDGLQLPNADAFERWTDEERRALQQTANNALEALASDAEKTRNPAVAVRWWSQLALADPLSSRVALRYMRAQVAAGDRSAAVQHARVHAALVRAELDVDADPSVAAYAEELRTMVVPPIVVVKPEIPPQSFAARTRSHQPDPASSSRNPAPVKSPANTTSASTVANSANRALPNKPRTVADRKSEPGWWLIAAMLVSVALTVAGVSRWRTPRSTPVDTVGIPVVAVLPFTVRGDSTREFLGEALSVLLSSRLDAPGLLRTLEANAVLSAVSRGGAVRRDDAASLASAEARVIALGAAMIVSGNVVVLGNRLEITAELRGNGEPASRAVRASVSGNADSLFALTDKLGAALLVAREGRAPDTSPLGGTSSIPALKALLAGERAMRNWQLFDAIAAYRSALAIDSLYAFARYRLAFAQGWAGVPGEQGIAARAAQLATQLPERYALLLRATVARSQNDSRAERDLLTLVQRYPDDADAWSELGEYRMHVGPLFGQPTTNAEAPLSRTLQLDSLGHPEVRWHLSQLAFERGDDVRARALMAPLLAHANGGDRIIRGYRLALALSGEDSIAALLLREMRDDASDSFYIPMLLATNSVGINRGAYAFAESLSARSSSAAHKARALSVLMHMDAAQQHWPQLLRDGALLADNDSLEAAKSWALLANGPALEVPKDIWRDAGETLEKLSDRDTSSARFGRLADAALLALRASDTAAFARRIRVLSQRSGRSHSDSVTLHTLRGVRAQLAGDTATETRELQSVRRPIVSQYARWVRAAWLERTGKLDEAERWYLSAPWGPFGVLYSRDAFEKASQLEARRGNAQESLRYGELARRFSGGR